MKQKEIGNVVGVFGKGSRLYSITVRCNMKTGYLTSEFWLTTIVMLSAVVLIILKVIDETTFKWLFTLTPIGYGVSRGLAKTNGGS